MGQGLYTVILRWKVDISDIFIIEGSGKCGGVCICDVGSSGKFVNLEYILRLGKIFNSFGILDLPCRADHFKSSSRYWWYHNDHDVTQECHMIVVLSFQLLCQWPMAGRGHSLPRNTRGKGGGYWTHSGLKLDYESAWNTLNVNVFGTEFEV